MEMEKLSVENIIKGETIDMIRNMTSGKQSHFVDSGCRRLIHDENDKIIRMD